ncbi:Sorting nexin-29 [Dermatophagoides pteronyssinus]|uniref:Sorting nexin-29 n=1 Tax=Dermatophagoides pteronyssinus TaxID=6956 RepID=A0ABQ8J2D0_DERPT|nr:Sorting nexin-29 [Dermatophagoides pteronyssinus]
MSLTTIPTSTNSDNLKCQQQHQLLINRLNSLITQCQNRFVNRYELATENDQLISNLLIIIEEIFTNGLLTKKSNKILGRGNKLFSNILSKNDTNQCFWNYISSFLTEHELKRFLSLRFVHTDLGRGRSWIRNCLNEHSLEKYFLMIVEDTQEHRQQFYDDSALLLSQEQIDGLPLSFKSLNSILFALNIDNADLDRPSSSSSSSSPKKFNDDDDTIIKSLAPIRKNDENNRLVKSTRKKSNLIIIHDNDDDDDVDDEYDEGQETSVACLARSAPVNSFLQSSSMSTIVTQESFLDETNNSSETKRSLSSLSINNESDSSKLILYPISDDVNILPSSSSSSSTTNNPISNDTNQNNDNQTDLYGKIDELQKTRDRLTKENNLLNIQMKKYIATIELLKYNKCTIQSQPSTTTVETYQQQQQQSSSSTHHNNDHSNQTINDYQKKLIQISEMHGEIIEFNEHLYKVIQIKDAIIARLRNELIELRGPLPDQDEVISISTELESNTHSLQSLPQPLIHVWIPTAFLSGGFKGKSHHIYQIYVRIKDEEWNVYRRYSQFYSLYRLLKNQYPTTAKYEFPPKKAIGNKDSRVVQERRKKLECYLRNVINHIQLQHMDINNKEKFTTILPFLSDKYFLQDRSQSESNLNQQQQHQQPQQSNTRNYLGF